MTLEATHKYNVCYKYILITCKGHRFTGPLCAYAHDVYRLCCVPCALPSTMIVFRLPHTVVTLCWREFWRE